MERRPNFAEALACAPFFFRYGISDRIRPLNFAHLIATDRILPKFHLRRKRTFWHAPIRPDSLSGPPLLPESYFGDPDRVRFSFLNPVKVLRCLGRPTEVLFFPSSLASSPAEIPQTLRFLSHTSATHGIPET